MIATEGTRAGTVDGMDATAVTSEKGGAGKTTVVVGLAASLAHDFGLRVGVVDLDPRSTATAWLGVEPPPGRHVGVILGQDDVAGAAAELALPSPWTADISVLAGSRDVAALEGMPQEYGDVRLRHALVGWDRDVVLTDTPNRQGGFIIRVALTACSRVIYATTAGEDERAGVAWARSNVERFRRLSPLNPGITEAGVIVTDWKTTVPSRDAKSCLAALAEENGDLLMRPLVPQRVIVREARSSESWWGMVPKGAPVADAFRALARQLWPNLTEGETR